MNTSPEKIQVLSSRGGVKGVEQIHVGEFAKIGILTTGCFSQLNVAPNHGCHVSVVIHEASVEAGNVGGVSRGKMGRPTGEWVL